MPQDEVLRIEDELRDLWKHVPLTPAHLASVSPTVTNCLSPTRNPSEALAVLLALLLERRSVDRAAASLAAAFGLGPATKSGALVDHRLRDAAVLYGKGSDQTGRRWSVRGAAALAAIIHGHFEDVQGPELEISLGWGERRQVLNAKVQWVPGIDLDFSGSLTVLVNDSAAAVIRPDGPPGSSGSKVIEVPFIDDWANFAVAWVSHGRPDISIDAQLGDSHALYVSERKWFVSCGITTKIAHRAVALEPE